MLDSVYCTVIRWQYMYSRYTVLHITQPVAFMLRSNLRRQQLSYREITKVKTVKQVVGGIRASGSG